MDVWLFEHVSAESGRKKEALSRLVGLLSFEVTAECVRAGTHSVKDISVPDSIGAAALKLPVPNQVWTNAGPNAR